MKVAYSHHKNIFIYNLLSRSFKFLSMFTKKGKVFIERLSLIVLRSIEPECLL